MEILIPIHQQELTQILAFWIDITNHLILLGYFSVRIFTSMQMNYSICSFIMKLYLKETHLAKNNLTCFSYAEINFQKWKRSQKLLCYNWRVERKDSKNDSNFTKIMSQLILCQKWNFLNPNSVSKTKSYNIRMPESYKYLTSGYPKYKNYCTKILSMLSHEQLFSIMKLNKTIALSEKIQGWILYCTSQHEMQDSTLTC